MAIVAFHLIGRPAIVSSNTSYAVDVFALAIRASWFVAASATRNSLKLLVGKFDAFFFGKGKNLFLAFARFDLNDLLFA